MASPLPEWRAKRYVPKGVYISWREFFRYDLPVHVRNVKLEGYSSLDAIDGILCLVADLVGWDLAETLAVDIIPMIFMGTRDACIGKAIEKKHTVINSVKRPYVVRKLFCYEHCSLGLPSLSSDSAIQYKFLEAEGGRQHCFNVLKKGHKMEGLQQNQDHFFVQSDSECRWSRFCDAKSAVVYPRKDPLMPTLELFDEKGRKRLVAWRHGANIIEHNLDAEIRRRVNPELGNLEENDLPDSRFFIGDLCVLEKFVQSWVFSKAAYWAHRLNEAVPIDLPPWELRYH